MRVPFVDLQAQHRPIQEELDLAVHRVMERGDFILGEDVARFEEEFAAYCGAKHAVGVGSGLAALELGLRALGVGPGDEVIVPSHTFIASAAAVTFAGAIAILVDVDPTTYCIDLEQVEAAVTPRTRAIIPVHLYGLPAEMDALLAIAERHGLAVVEDACQAHGASYKGRRTGSLGTIGAFSFYPSKNLGGIGDGGIVLTNDSQIAERVRAMRNCGQVVKNRHELPPFNHRLDTIQAAVLRVKLRHLDAWNLARRQSAALYADRLREAGVALPTESDGSTHVYHVYVVRSRRRDALQTHLRERDIGTGIHYPAPVHLQPFYASDGYRQGQFPVAERLCSEVLSLPMFPGMSVEQVQYVAEQVVEVSIGVPETGIA